MNIKRVDVEPDEHGWAVRTHWTGVDRPCTHGFIVSQRRVAERLAQAIKDGAVYANPEVRTDTHGRTYVNATSRVLARKANADLRRLGY